MMGKPEPFDLSVRYRLYSKNVISLLIVYLPFSATNNYGGR